MSGIGPQSGNGTLRTGCRRIVFSIPFYATPCGRSREFMNLRHGVPAALHLRGLPMLKTVEIEAEAMMVSSIFPPAGNSRPSEQQNGGGIVLIPPRFTLFASFSGGPSAWGLGCALPRCGSRDFRISQRIPKIRTRPQSETDSDFVGLVRLTGVE